MVIVGAVVGSPRADGQRRAGRDVLMVGVGIFMRGIFMILLALALIGPASTDQRAR